MREDEGTVEGVEEFGALPRAERGKSRSELRLGWRRAAIGAMTLALASLTALAIVATVGNANVLATVALAVVVVAVIVQIIVSVTQSAAASRQVQRSEALYSEAQGVLREARASAQAALGLQRVQFEILLRQALQELSASVRDSGEIDLVGLTEQVGAKVQLALAQELESARSAGQPSVRRPSISPSLVAKSKWLNTWPNLDEAGKLTNAFSRLSPGGMRSFQRYANDLAGSVRVGRVPGLLWDGDNRARGELLELGVIEEDRRGDASFGRLTSLGESLARLVLAPGSPPDYLAEALYRRPGGGPRL